MICSWNIFSFHCNQVEVVTFTIHVKKNYVAVISRKLGWIGGSVKIFLKNLDLLTWFCFPGSSSPDTENDFLLAQMLQLEYDKENDRSVDSMERRYNGESKGMHVYMLEGFPAGFCHLVADFCIISCNGKKKKMI